MPPPGDARTEALRILLEYSRRNAYLNVLLLGHRYPVELDRRDRAFVIELVQGTVRMLLTLDWALSFFSNREISSLDETVIWVLRLSAYQVLFTQVPDYAAVDRGAALARENGAGGAVGFVNAVLRALAREKDSLPWPDPTKDAARYLEVRYSHPPWIVQMWLDELGRDRAEALCAAGNSPRPVSLRCNLLKVEREALASRLRLLGAEVEVSGLVPEGLLVRGIGPLAELDEFTSGMFAVQDQGAIVVGHAVDPEPGMEVLDACAAPGGKANHLAELMSGSGAVLAVDINPDRLVLVQEAAGRLGNAIVSTMVMDATDMGESIRRTFDRVLVDAPCTGLGTLSRRPDVRWRKRPGDVDRLAALQTSILAEAAGMVREGGMLVYSTCTISKRENQDVVASFLDSHPRFSQAGGGWLAPLSGGAGSMQLFPDEHGCDGTFVSRMARGSGRG